MNNQLRSLRIEASILDLPKVAYHLELAWLHPQNRDHHLAEALELAESYYFGADLAERLKKLINPVSTYQFECEYDNCGQVAANEILYRDSEGEDIYYTMRCEQHTSLESGDLGLEADMDVRPLRTGQEVHA